MTVSIQISSPEWDTGKSPSAVEMGEADAMSEFPSALKFLTSAELVDGAGPVETEVFSSLADASSAQKHFNYR